VKAVFEYHSYREFLKDYYQSKKKENPAFSFRYFSKKAGLQSGNYLKLVMDGERSITQKTVSKFIQGLNLNEWEALYFENLVFFNHAKDKIDKDYYSKNMELAKSHHSQVILTKDQYEVLTNWYPLAIKELSLLPEFKLDYRWISNRLKQKITPKQAKEAVDLLERLNLIKVDLKKGKIHNTSHTMLTPEVDTSEPISIFHKNAMELGREAIDQQSVEERHLHSLIVALNKKDLPEAFKKISKFTNEMNDHFMKGKPYDVIYQLAIQLYRMDADV
jgi:uncharacterized protein (TIGR02147 family)